MGLYVITKREKKTIKKEFRVSNNEIRVTNDNIKISQVEYTSDQL